MLSELQSTADSILISPMHAVTSTAMARSVGPTMPSSCVVNDVSRSRVQSFTSITREHDHNSRDDNDVHGPTRVTDDNIVAFYIYSTTYL